MDFLGPKLCQHCGKELAGRLDKKFCDDQCRSTYHNHSKPENERMIAAVNRQLRKNRTVLKHFCPLGKATVRKQALEEIGFSFKYFTSMYPTKSNRYYFCYEYGFCPISETSSNGEMIQKVLIIQKQDYMTQDFDPWH